MFLFLFFFFKLNLMAPNGSSNSALFLIRCLPCWRVSLNVYIFLLCFVTLNFVSSYVAVIRSQWKNGARNEILWWLKGLWLQLVQRVICNLNIYRFFTLKHFREQIPLNTLLEKLVTLPSHYLWVLNTSFKKNAKN